MLRRFCLEILLILSVVLLIGQLACPSARRWWNRPKPGAIGIGNLASSGGLASQYAICLPQQYAQGSKNWPLVVFLHGAGERGNDVATLQKSAAFAVLRARPDFPAIIAAPQCLPDAQWESPSIVAFVRHLQSVFRVEDKQVYLIGYSMGGYGTWRVAATYPDVFAAIVPICGGGEPNHATALAKVPVWAFHGANDQTVPLVESQQMVDAIRAAGGQPKLTVFEDGGHSICDDVCQHDELWDWLLSQQRRD